MNNSGLFVRELQEKDIGALVNYWITAEDSFLTGMGCDLKKIPTKDAFTQLLQTQLKTPIELKRAYCIIWENNGIPIGHSNTNPTVYGEEATMHLHLWKNETRKKGIGTAFVKLTLPLYFENLKIKKLICEPYALNPAPNKTLEKIGFDLVKEYTTTPGSLNFEQPVKRWEITRERFLNLKS